MKTFLVAFLVAHTALAQSTPTDVPFAAKTIDGHAKFLLNDQVIELEFGTGLFINDLGIIRLQEAFDKSHKDLVGKQVENAQLKQELDKIVENPPLNIKTAILIAVGALVVGAATAVGITVAVTKK